MDIFFLEVMSAVPVGDTDVPVRRTRPINKLAAGLAKWHLRGIGII